MNRRPHFIIVGLLAAALIGVGLLAIPGAPFYKTPILGLYGANDERVNSTIPAAKAALAKAGVRYEPVTYEGAGHGFVRQQDSEANKKAARESWKKALAFLSEHTS